MGETPEEDCGVCAVVPNRNCGFLGTFEGSLELLLCLLSLEIREKAGICGGEEPGEEGPAPEMTTEERFEEEEDDNEVTEEPKGDRDGGGGANPVGVMQVGAREGGGAATLV